MTREEIIQKFKDSQYYLQIDILESWFKTKGFIYKLENNKFNNVGKTQNYRTACDKVFGVKNQGNIEVEELNFRKYNNCLILNTQEDVFKKLIDYLNKEDKLSFSEIYEITKKEFKYF